MKQAIQRILILLAVAIIAALLQGCGGSTSISVVHGSVSDIDRNVVVDAKVWVGALSTKSLVTGAFRLENVPSGWQTVRASATIDGRLWVGATAVEVLSNQPTMNANIVLSPAGDVTDIEGYVFDDTGRRVADARVLVTTRALLPSESSAWDGAYNSIVAITDDRGYYRLRDVPVGLSAVITASKVAYNNDEVKIDSIRDGMDLDFELTASTQDTPGRPTLEWVESWTMPNPLVKSFSAKAESGGNPYEAVKAHVSRRYRDVLASRKTAAASMQTVRSASDGSLIEIDVYWNGLDTTLSRYVAGYGIYRSVAGGDMLAIDFVRDPYANFYGDMGGEIRAGTRYSYRVSTVHVEFLDRWNRPIEEAEGVWSEDELGVSPLGYLNATAPANGASVGTAPQFSWRAVPGAAAYSVFVYDRFPSVPLDPAGDYGGNPPSYGVFPVWTSPWANVTSVIYDGPALQVGRTYYWLVIARNADENAYSYGELRSFGR